jgi:riboflavin kinase / FMN adenylyltransferase
MELSCMIVNRLEDIPPLPSPIALSIGTFDGVHLGHQHLLKELKKRGTAAVLTFSSHPADTLHPENSPPLICTLEQKLSRLQAHGADLIIVLPFTPELAAVPYDTFLKQILSHLPFSYLIVGKGDAFGHQAQGHESNILPLSKELDFEAIYLPKFTFEGEVVSSRKIRTLIEEHNFEQVFRLLKDKLW